MLCEDCYSASKREIESQLSYCSIQGREGNVLSKESKSRDGKKWTVSDEGLKIA